MTEVKVELYDELRDLVADVLELEPGELTGTSSFVEDHGVDSLSLIELCPSARSATASRSPNRS